MACWFNRGMGMKLGSKLVGVVEPGLWLNPSGAFETTTVRVRTFEVLMDIQDN